MAEIEILLPSVQFGNVKVRATPEEFGVDVADAAAIGAMAAVYLNAFKQGYQQGSAVDVTVDVHVSVPSVKVTENEAQAAVQELQRQLGATVVSEEDTLPEPDVPDDEPEENDNIPWNREVAAKAKPWENDSKPAKIAEIDW